MFLVDKFMDGPQFRVAILGASSLGGVGLLFCMGGSDEQFERTPEQSEECFEEGFRTKARTTARYAEVYELCIEFDITDPGDIPSLCGNYPSRVYTRWCEDFDVWTREAEREFVDYLPEFRAACESDASCICAAMDGDIPEWWDLDDPNRAYIYECHQVYVNGEWVSSEHNAN